MVRAIFLLILGLAIAIGCETGINASQSSFTVRLPIDCDLGENCFVLLYPDRDPSPNAVDVGCGRMTYDGHQGTDFAIPDEQVMAAGVPVKAVAEGTVLRIRDGIPDRRIETPAQETEVSDIECGNGMVVDHADGWETQYCHLRQGSVEVKAGDRVTPDTTLGMVGQSGLASFPHVHLTVRHQGDVVDPFVGPNAGDGCNVSKQPLWQEPLPYVPTGLVRAGFAPRPPELDELWEGEFADSTLAASSSALIFWAQVYGVLAGDVESIQLIDSDGTAIANQQTPLQDSNRIWFSYAGKQSPDSGFQPGTWQGRYQLTRGDRTLVDIQKELRVE
ncbi:MAG: M23 family metallopeptidase [Elainellaceae cyanobacterium]